MWRWDTLRPGTTSPQLPEFWSDTLDADSNDTLFLDRYLKGINAEAS
jgi:hypothetical protein